MCENVRLPSRYRVGMGTAGRPPAPVECLRCSLRRSEDARGDALELLDAALSPPLWPKPNKREKNGFLPVPDCRGEGGCVVDVAVYIERAGACKHSHNKISIREQKQLHKTMLTTTCTFWPWGGTTQYVVSDSRLEWLGVRARREPFLALDHAGSRGAALLLRGGSVFSVTAPRPPCADGNGVAPG